MYCKNADYVLPYYLMNFLANFYLLSGLVLLYSNSHSFSFPYSHGNHYCILFSQMTLYSEKYLSCVWLFVIPWTLAYQDPLSLEFSRQEYWSGLPFPSPEDLPNPGIKSSSPALQADALPYEPPGKPLYPDATLFLRIVEKTRNFFQFTRYLWPSPDCPLSWNVEHPELTRPSLFIDKVWSICSWDPTLWRTWWSPALRPVTKAFGVTLSPSEKLESNSISSQNVGSQPSNRAV